MAPVYFTNLPRQGDAHSRRFQFIDGVIILAVFVVLCVRAQDPPLSQTVLSRLATVVALAEDDTWYIDRPTAERPNPFEVRTIDKVQVQDRLLSSKPPLLPWLMTWEYRVLNSLFGWSLDNLADTKRILYAYTLTFCVVPWTAALVAAVGLFRRAISSRIGRSTALASLAFGTQLSGFASVFNNHVPAAAALVICVWLVLPSFSSVSGRRAAAAGLAGGLAATFDVPNAIYVVAIAVLLLMRPRNWNWLVFGLAAAIPLLVQSWLLYTSTGSPLPVQVRPETYFYESSYWRSPLGVDALSEPKGVYLFNMTFGNRGIFLLFPVLLTGLIGFVAGVMRPVACRVPILGAGVCFAVILGYYTMGTSNYGGEAYGMRWLIPSMPVLILMGLPVWRRMQHPVLLGTWLLLLAVSAYSAWECGVSPWTSGQEWPRRFFEE